MHGDSDSFDEKESIDIAKEEDLINETINKIDKVFSNLRQSNDNNYNDFVAKERFLLTLAAEDTCKLFFNLLDDLYELYNKAQKTSNEVADIIEKIRNTVLIDKVDRFIKEIFKEKNFSTQEIKNIKKNFLENITISLWDEYCENYCDYAHRGSSQLMSYIEHDYRFNKNSSNFKKIFFWKYFGRPEQLSDQGIALLSHLYAIKDGCEHQPLFVDCRESLEHLKKEMMKTPIGTEVTIIQDNIEFRMKNQEDRISHRISKKITNTGKGLAIIELNSKSRFTADPKKDNFIIIGDIGEGRQLDRFSCGIFAIKDARFLNKNIKIKIDRFKPLPNKLLHSLQSKDFKKIPYMFERLEHHKEGKHKKTVLKNGKQKIINNYPGYFANKHCKSIRKFIEENDKLDIIEHVRKYDAASITTKELTRRFEQRKKITDDLNPIVDKMKTEAIYRQGRH